MKLYRVQYWNDMGEHCGSDFLPTKVACRRSESAWRGCKAKGARAETDEVTFTPTKKGILDLLQRVAAHPNNG
jgi:hypothetical protein